MWLDGKKNLIINKENIISPENNIIAPIDKFAIFEARLKKLEDRGRKRGKRYSRIGLIYSIIICAAVLISGFIIIQQINDFSDMAAESANSISEMNNNNQTKGKLVFHTAWKNCLNDSDCVETQKDCCLCNSGGEKISINSLFLAEWDNLLKKNCKNTVCPSVSSCQIGISLCKEKRCFFEASEISTSTENTAIATTTGQNFLDADNDGLTNEKEIKYGTDLNNPDTDSDGFLDGDEVNKGFNPKGDGLLLNKQ
jgi:hypothetical protein